MDGLRVAVENLGEGHSASEMVSTHTAGQSVLGAFHFRTVMKYCFSQWGFCYREIVSCLSSRTDLERIAVP